MKKSTLLTVLLQYPVRVCVCMVLCLSTCNMHVASKPEGGAKYTFSPCLMTIVYSAGTV